MDFALFFVYPKTMACFTIGSNRILRESRANVMCEVQIEDVIVQMQIQLHSLIDCEMIRVQEWEVRTHSGRTKPDS